jgi:hypothetical protein
MNDAMILSIGSAVASGFGILVAACRHTRFRSLCCGMKVEASLDIDSKSVSVKDTPPPPAAKETPD